MKEIRITFRGDDFAAVSKSLIDLGVSFRVEPIASGEDDAAPGVPATPRRREGKRAPAKPPRQRAAWEPDRLAERESAAAARLRAMAERNRAASGRSGEEARDVGAGTHEANTPDEGA